MNHLLKTLWDQLRSDSSPKTKSFQEESVREVREYEKWTRQLWDQSANYRKATPPAPEEAWQHFQAQRQKKAHNTSFSTVLILTVLLLLVGFLLFRTFKKELPAPSKDRMEVAIGPEGKHKAFQLPDGSTIILNANSAYRLGKNFSKDRVVEFEGEAVFDILPNKGPFRIITPDATIDVMGTRFNLRAYPYESFTEVEVEEGIVQFTDIRTGESRTVEAWERAQYWPEKEKMITGRVPAPNAQAWLTNDLRFISTPFPEACAQLERHLRISIHYDANLVSDCLINGDFELASIQASMQLLAATVQAEVHNASNGHWQLVGGTCQ